MFFLCTFGCLIEVLGFFIRFFAKHSNVNSIINRLIIGKYRNIFKRDTILIQFCVFIFCKICQYMYSFKESIDLHSFFNVFKALHYCKKMFTPT